MSRAAIDETHRVDLESWVESAQSADTDFPIQNLPFGVFRRAGTSELPRVGVAIGDQIVDVTACLNADLLDSDAAAAAERCAVPRLNDVMALGSTAASALRRALSRLLRKDSEALRGETHLGTRILVAMKAAELFVPCDIGDYTDFYASVHHATNVGSMFRPDNPLLPNYKWVPIGYHGRASSIVVSGTHVRRPRGQRRDDAEAQPVLAPTRRLDYELEIGAFVGSGNALGVPIALGDAERHVFGLCLVNDWSARDIQSWEYQPLGPFLAKSFATTVSPWVVTLEALAPFRGSLEPRAAGDPAPLPYLRDDGDQTSGGVDIVLEVYITSASMRERRIEPLRLSRARFTEMYWTTGQLLTHHTVNGCNLRPGDLLASGTVSGSTRESWGSMLERAWRGTDPIELPTGERRSFLEDGDEIVLRGFCEREGRRRIGFGECRGTIIGSD